MDGPLSLRSRGKLRLVIDHVYSRQQPSFTDISRQVSSWTILNSEESASIISVTEATVNGLFRAMVSTLYDQNFLENLSGQS